MPANGDLAAHIKFVWAKRKFGLSPAQAAGLGVLRWNRIAFGAAAFVNGRKVGENAPTGPYQVIVTPGVLQPGENEIVLRIAGAAGVRRSKSGYFLIPAGFASNSGRGMPQVADDVWIDFADTVYVKWALALPDLSASRVRIRVTPAGLRRVDGLRIRAQVRPWPDGDVIGEAEVPARLAPAADPLEGEHFFVEVPMPGFRAWTPEEPHLYRADITVTIGGKVLDALTLRFGMREIEAVGPRFKLNGSDIWLSGSELVGDWDWAPVQGKEKAYLVTEAHEMSMNSFRTHTQPPPRLWADNCDEYGTMILAEFPCLYNNTDYEFTPEEYAIWHKNVLTDAAAWMARLWNHPSVIMWVLSNESHVDATWEAGPYRDFVVGLDPTRPTLRAGAGNYGNEGTKENLDFHACWNITRTEEGQTMLDLPQRIQAARGRTLTCTEYMNTFERPVTQWTGTDDEEADRLAAAQIGMEHTEAMRRARLAGIWPYMYAGWTKTRHGGRQWKAGFADPLSAVWHSALSPVLVSPDLFNPDYLTGQEVTTDLYLINDSARDANIHVELLLTRESPEFIPEAECLNSPIARWDFDFELKSDTLTTTPVTWRLPAAEGQYWLAARTTGLSGRPVLSQRFVRAIDPPVATAAARRRTFVLLGADPVAAAYFQSKGLKTSGDLRDLKPGEQVVIVWNAERVTAGEKAQAGSLRRFAAAGGRVIVLRTNSWDWHDLCDVTIPIGSRGDADTGRYSRAFIYPGAEHPVLSGIGQEFLTRWNGLPGTVALAPLQGAALASAKRILWAREPGNIIAAEVPVAEGAGTILFSQLDLQPHLDSSNANYDPVAESIFLNMLGR
jgi:hypothetical protein